MKTFLFARPLISFFCISLMHLYSPSRTVFAAAEPENYLTAGIGIEQLSYKEKIPDINLSSSDSTVTNWVVLLEGQKSIKNFFIGGKTFIPVTDDDTKEHWTRDGQFEQTNTLSYKWFRVSAHLGYFLHQLLNPYVGINYGYSEQDRSNFDNVNNPEIIYKTATEEVDSWSVLFGMRGKIIMTPKWSFDYLVEYLLAFDSETTNSELPGWKATDVDGYSYSITGRLNYALAETVSMALQVTGGSQHWDGSKWIPVNDTRAKWPENDTDFISAFINIKKSF
ncbi:MAG: hypothetical protein IME97_06850 [Proteobacteria bacterium]|nr:hypothetical protein [Pseudomonadota bacterium]